MPPKSNRLKVNQKADLAEKVREIKQRQENWFKERNQQKSRLSPTEGYKSTTPPRAIVRQTHTIRKNSSQSPPSDLPDATLPDSRKVRPGGFKNWLQNQQHVDSPDASPAGSYDTQDDVTRERLLSRTHQRSLSPEMFDALADQIVHKVKRELRIDSDVTSGDETQGGHVTSSPSPSPSGRGTTQKLSSHHCQICSRLMLAPNCSPQLLIPCGHTFCAGCVSAHERCPACNTCVQTVTANIMLQQVIVEYAQSQTTRNGTPKRAPSRGHQPKVKARDFSGEYETLTLRCEVMEAEAEDIQGRMSQLEARAQQKVAQAEQVRDQEQLIEEQIEQLREEQRSLVEDREAIMEESESIRDLVREQEGQLDMVRSTIRNLRKDMDKIKRLANGTPR